MTCLVLVFRYYFVLTKLQTQNLLKDVSDFRFSASLYYTYKLWYKSKERLLILVGLTQYFPIIFLWQDVKFVDVIDIFHMSNLNVIIPIAHISITFS